jgi:alcohol dehydrogenase
MLAAQRFTMGTGGTTLFGAGTAGELPAIVGRFPYRRVFLISDRGLVDAGVVAEIEALLASAGIEIRTFAGVRPNPDTEDLEAGADLARAFGEAVVVALGGGSVLDVSKALALMAVNPGVARDFDYRFTPPRPGLPIVAIPTTAGTGSETNSFGVIEDHLTRRKFYAGNDSVYPRAIILDPELTLGLPAIPTAASGMDVLVHALESLSSVRTNPYAEGVSLQVVRMVRDYLPRAVADGRDLEARAQMLLAAHMAGLAFATTGLGMAHAVGHSLSARLAAAHGVALSVLLPHVLAFNLPVRAETYSHVAHAFGVGRPGGSPAANAEAAIEAVRQLARDVGMPAYLRELGCTAEIIPAIADDALTDEVMANTPRMPRSEELCAVLQIAL